MNLESKFTKFNFSFTALVLRKLTAMLPSRRVDSSQWNHLSGIQLADPQYYVPGHIDVILGADVYSAILLDGLKRGSPSAPVAQRTSLGWLVVGTSSPTSLHPPTQIAALHAHGDEELSQIL